MIPPLAQSYVVTGGAGGIGRAVVERRNGTTYDMTYTWWHWHDAYDVPPSQEHLDQIARVVAAEGGST